MKFAALLAGTLFAGSAFAQDSPYTVSIRDGKTVSQAAELPIDPVPRLTMTHYGNAIVGLQLGNITIMNGGAWPQFRVDGALVQSVNLPNQNTQALPLSPTGKPRHGWQVASRQGDLQFTLVTELVPSKPGPKNVAGKRLLDTARMTYVLENKGSRDVKVEFKVSMDMFLVNNDGALFASPTTHPDKILNGVELKGKDLPEYFLGVENANAKNPGMTTTFSLKNGLIEGPQRVVLTQLGAISGVNGWDVLPQAAGDSACALFWESKTLRPGEKRTMAWAYGAGLASNPENEGKVAILLGGSFEPKKVFTILAQVDDPVFAQTLTLDLPPGMTRLEGKEIQPVPAPVGSGSSMVFWKARVDKFGAHELKIRSSTGVTLSKHITVSRNEP